MTTSGAITSTMTVGELISAALELIGVTRPGATLKSAQEAVGIKHLNWMLKKSQTQHLIWLEQEHNLPSWPADTKDATLDPRIFDVIGVRLVDGDNQIELQRYERDEYEAIPNKDAEGDPTIYSVVKERSNYRLRIWPVPTAITPLKVLSRRVIEDVTAASQHVDAPQEWLECIYHMLADRLIPVFGVASTPEAQLVSARAGAMYADLVAHDRYGSVYLQPADDY